MVLLAMEKGEWKVITKEEKENNYSPSEREKILYMDGKLMTKLDFVTKVQNKNNDVSILGTGGEGTGKSSLLGNIMRYKTNDTFNPKKDMIGSDWDDAINKIDSVENKGSLFFDEFVVFGLSTEVMKKESRSLHKIFSIIRQKNLFCLFAIPSFFRLNSYFALDRSRFMVRTYLKGGERGYFAYYGEKNKAKLYGEGRQSYNIHAVKPNFRGRFTPCYTLENQSYKNFKAKTLKDTIDSIKTPKEKIPTEEEIKRKVIREIIKNNLDYSPTKLAQVLNLSNQWIHHIKNEIKKEKIPA